MGVCIVVAGKGEVIPGEFMSTWSAAEAAVAAQSNPPRVVVEGIILKGIVSDEKGKRGTKCESTSRKW